MKKLGYHLIDCDKVITSFFLCDFYSIIILSKRTFLLLTDIYPYTYEHPLDIGCY